MRFLRTLAALAALLVPSLALAQSSPNLRQGQVPTPAQWNSYFAAKQDVLGFVPMSTTGGTFSGRIVTAPPGTAAGLNLTPGSAPIAPVNGDVWATSASLFARINGATIDLVNSACPTCVTGPSSSAAGNIAYFSDTTGKAIAAAPAYHAGNPANAALYGTVANPANGYSTVFNGLQFSQGAPVTAAEQFGADTVGIQQAFVGTLRIAAGDSGSAPGYALVGYAVSHASAIQSGGVGIGGFGRPGVGAGATNLWGGNFGVSNRTSQGADSGIQLNSLIGLEIDVELGKAANGDDISIGQTHGLLIIGNNTSTLNQGVGVSVFPLSVIAGTKWEKAYHSSDGAAVNAFLAGATAQSGTSLDSQPILFKSVSAGGLTFFSRLFADAGGNFNIQAGTAGANIYLSDGTSNFLTVVTGGTGAKVQFNALNGGAAGLIHNDTTGMLSTGKVVSADLNITGTSCTNQVVTAISAAAAGTCSTVSNAMLANSSLTVNGTAISLGGSGTITAAPSGAAGGELAGTYPNPTLATAQPTVHTWALVQTFTVAPVFTDQSGSRTALGLGTMSTQAASAVAITGGTINGAVIGGSTPAAITGTTVTASTAFTTANGAAGGIFFKDSVGAADAQIFEGAAGTLNLKMGTANSLNVTTSASVAVLDYGVSVAGKVTIAPALVLGSTLNGNTFTSGTYTLTGAAGKTLTFSNSLTLAGTDGTTMTFPATSASIARTDAGQTFTGTNVFSSTITGSISGNAATVTTNANLTGDVSSIGNGTTLATVNSNVGTFGSATQSVQFTVNAKGLLTAAANVTIAPAIGSVTGLGTGVATALGIAVGSAGGPVTFNGAGGTPSSITLTNGTGLPYAALPALSANQVLGALTATTPSGLSVPSCSTAGSAIQWTSGTGFGCKTGVFSTSNAVLNAAPADPVGTALTTRVMMGLGTTCTITPVNSTRVKFTITGQVNNNTAGSSSQYRLAFGTGTAPANAAALTGTAFGSAAIIVNGGGGSGGFNMPFTATGIGTGLSTGTAYWFDMQLGAVTTGTASIISLGCTANED